MKKYFYAKWFDRSNGGQIGNVSFFARSVHEAIRKADRIGREIGLPTSARHIQQDCKIVHTKP